MAVGLEQLGVEEFIERKFFDGGKYERCTALIDINANRNIY